MAPTPITSFICRHLPSARAGSSVPYQQPGPRQRFVYGYAASNQLLKRLRPAGEIDVVEIEAEPHVAFELRRQLAFELARQGKHDA